MADNDTDSKMRLTIGMIVVALVVLMGVVALVSSRPAPQQTTEDARDDKDEKAAKADDVLDSAWSGLQPDRFRVTSDRGAIVATLNEWLVLSGNAEEQRLSESDRRSLSGLLSPEELSAIEQPRFTKRDADHIGACLIELGISEQVVEGLQSDLERAVRLFDYVCRNMTVVDPAEHVPCTRFQRMLFGRGNAADRAQLFANVARQLHIDTVIIRPSSKEQSATDSASSNDDYWLVGVLLEDEVYLFDAHLGWPVPAPTDDGSSVIVHNPATLADAINDDSVLRQLDISDEQRYPLSAADLRDPQIELIGNTSLWSPIMKRLQRSLSGDRSVVVYDGLQDDADTPGLRNRVAAYAGTQWDPEKTTIWTYPADQLSAMNPEAPEYQELGRRLRRFNVPLERVKVDVEQMTVVFGDPQKAQLKNRISQLLGDYEKAVTVYLTIRFDADLPVQFKIAPRIRSMHQEAIDDSLFWIGICQYELQDYAAAAETFRNYSKLQRTQSIRGAWGETAAEMLAFCLAQEGRLTEATLRLTTLDDDLPRHRGARLRMKRWRAMLQEDTADSDSETGE